MTSPVLICAAALLCLAASLSASQEPKTAGPDKGAKEVQGEAPAQGSAETQDPQTPPELDFEKGKVKVGENLATLDLPDGFLYLQEKDARLVIEKAWGNPPAEGRIGLIIPPGEDVFAEKSWAIVVSWSEDGHVKDSDAADMDYNELLGQMQESTKEANKIRKEKGYPTMELVGWAERPHYDSVAKKLYWAKDLQFEGEDTRVLNYDIRILGRRGVLTLTAVADITDLVKVSKGCKGILDKVAFNKGHRYEDYQAGDKVPAYGNR